MGGKLELQKIQNHKNQKIAKITMNPLVAKRKLEACNDSAPFKITIKCTFEQGTEKSDQVLQETWENKKATYSLCFPNKGNNPLPLTVTIVASTKSQDLSQETIWFEETKLLPFGQEASIEITLGKSFLHATGWTTRQLPGDYPKQNLESIPQNLAYNTIVSTQNLVPVSILNLEPKPITKVIGLMLTSGHFNTSRFVGHSTLIPNRFDLDTYIFNLSNRLLGLELCVEPKVTPDSKLHFNIKPDSPLEFTFSCVKKFGFTRVL